MTFHNPIHQYSNGSLPAGAADYRSTDRLSIATEGRIRYDGSSYRITLADLSEMGCRFWIPRRQGIPTRTDIRIFIDQLGPFEATVRWCRDGWTGVQFALPIYPPILAHMRSLFATDPANA